jgi:hypothetical protein
MVAALVAPPAKTAYARAFWLAADDPVVQTDKGRSQPADYMDLFRSGSPWAQSARGLSTFKISTQFATRSSSADLATVITRLRELHVGLAIEIGMLAPDRGCGRGEGYIPLSTLDRAMSRIQKAGGSLDFIAMDEVVFYGREKSWRDRGGQVPCQDTVEELVKEVAASVLRVRQYFPLAQVGDIEPLGSQVDSRILVGDYLSFAREFKAATSTQLAFFHADVAWKTEWQPGLIRLKAGLKSLEIPFGVIIDGSPDAPTDAAWTAEALLRLQELDSSDESSPEHVVVQSWQAQPHFVLPENEDGTLTNLLLRAEAIHR